MFQFLLSVFLISLFFLPGVSQADVLCPDPFSQASQRPGDLSQVQSDIDRYSLCVERTRLLNELNNLVKEQEEILNPSTEEDEDNALSQDTQPPAPNRNNENINRMDNTLSLESTLPTRETAPKNEIVASANDNNNPQSVSDDEDETEDYKQDWLISSISGQGENIRAKLVSADPDNNRILNVMEGDRLPDQSVVSTVSTSGVVLLKDEKTYPINWDASMN